MSLLIRNVFIGHTRTSLLIQDGMIVQIGAELETAADRTLDGSGLHAFPSLRNGHTHVAMTLFRGTGDDMPLMPWLETRIWPVEARLTEEDVYDGARLGMLEMILGGTTFLNEMYWHRPALVRAADEMGLRALIGSSIIGIGDAAALDAQKREMRELVEEDAARAASRTTSSIPRIRLSLAPHSIYTVPVPVLEWVAELSDDHRLPVHIHLSETVGEVDRCVAEHGCRPAELLRRAGLVSSRLIAAHGQFLDRDELDLLGAAGATLVTNPTANLKLATGGIFPYRAARDAGVRITIGTDGAGSNNNLDLLEEMKFAALLQKHREGDATVLPAAEALALATRHGAEAFEKAPGTLTEGAPADLILVDLRSPSTEPVHDPVSALVYAANASHVDTTICAGRVLMHRRRVEVCDPEEVIARAREVARRRFGRP